MPDATKNITLQEEEPSLRVTSGVSRVGGDSRQRSEFENVGALAPRKSRFFMKFHHPTLPRVQACKPFVFFPHPMDRAEVLHAQNYDIEDRRKNTPNENDQVRS